MAEGFKIGFNLFAIISDCYYRENLHSDILRALIDPNGEHGEHDKYLRLFLKFIRSGGAKINLSDYSNARVEREEGRIDLLIKGLKDAKGLKHAIIIENKINGAIDQPRQLPDYLKKVKDDGYNCDAIIYLRLNGNIPPDTAHWTDDERKQVNAILKRICAYDGDEDGTEKDLLKGWILKCIDESKENPNAQHILRQYRDIIKQLGKNVMNKPVMDEFYKIIVEGENLETALSFKKMLDDLVLYRVKNIMDTFQENLMPFNKIESVGGYDAKFSNCSGNNANLGLDILVTPKSYLFHFWDSADRDGTKNGQAEAILHKMGCFNDYACQEGGVFVKEFKFPSGEAGLIKHITEFKKNLTKIVEPKPPASPA